ncbi:MAG: glycosyltransferase family 2 protein [Candidatus Latescibacteria bacterium]|nr:glycosyltransferase family 2 protein [Candidatus Latescibacterota bacterium]
MTAPPTELSICIISWNTKALTRNCLTSLFEDPRSDGWQVIVVDNDSADASADMVAAEFPVVELVRSDRNLGFAGGNNLAMAQARGSNLLLLNSDTRVAVGALGHLIDHLAQAGDVGAVGPRLVNGVGQLELSCGREPGLTPEIVHKLLLHRVFPFFRFGRWNHGDTRDVGWVTGACLMVRRQALETAGALDDGIFMCFEDLEWCMRLRAAGWRIEYVPGCQVVHLEGQSIRQRMGDMLVVSQQSLYYLFQKHFSRGHLHALRLLTAVEMILRTVLWSALWTIRPGGREEAGHRLAAYRAIFRRTFADRSYWAPRDGAAAP